MNRNTRTTFLVALCALAVAINVIGGTVVTGLKIPLLFLDAAGTIFIAALYGPWYGLLVGLITNLVLGVTAGPTNIPFGLVNGVIGLTVGFVSSRWGFSLITSIITGAVLSILCPIVGTPIAVAVFGGLTGGATDVFVLWLKSTGMSMFTAAFLPRLADNLVDKLLSCVLVFIVLRALPKSLLARMGYQGGHRAA
jgi:energy-coupling factor transport system substrate-specific component